MDIFIRCLCRMLLKCIHLHVNLLILYTFSLSMQHVLVHEVWCAVCSCQSNNNNRTNVQYIFLHLFSGYGGISPRTQWGRIAALVYALFGIPIVLLYLSAMGEGLSNVMRFLFRKLRLCGRGRKKDGSGSGSTSSNTSTNSSTGSVVGIKMSASENGLMEKRSHNYNGNGTKSSANYLASSQRYGSGAGAGMGCGSGYYHHSSYHQHSPSVPISICIMILICYVTMGAVLFNRIQNWGVLESLYFCFTSLGTIGFGDLLPKGQVAHYAASAYILIGMAVVAMCFSLIQTELVMWLRRFGVQDTQQTHPASTSSMPATTYNHMMHPKHLNHMMHHQQTTATTPSEDVALVTVAVTPKSWLRQPDFLGGTLEGTSTFNSLPRRSTAFQRNTPARRSAGPLESHMEYFVPRSVSEFNLSGVGDIAIPMQQLPPQTQRHRSPPNISHTHSSGTIMIPIQTPLPPKPREKMVTFEDDAKCPHGIPTTPRKSGPIVVGDVFMWREGGWDEAEAMQCPGDVIKVWSSVVRMTIISYQHRFPRGQRGEPILWHCIRLICGRKMTSADPASQIFLCNVYVLCMYLLAIR